jgi:hypothetical protein
MGGEKPFILQLREELQIYGTVRDICFLRGYAKSARARPK